MPLFIKNFLSERKFRVRVGTSLSEFYDQEMGIPQGSILSVTLLIVKINSIISCIRNGVDKSLFVDDLGKGEDPPRCTACDCQLTVKHILFECVDFIESRNRHFSVNNFRELFKKVPPDSILSYLHEIGLFYRL